MQTEPVLTVRQMQDAEQAAMASGTDEWELMQRAGRGAAEYVWRIAAGRDVTVLCGPGNNGGDGYVIAETLRERGLDVAVVAPMEPKTDTARKARSSFAGTVLDTVSGRTAPIMVDCLFGYGLSRPVEGDFATELARAAETHPYRIAIDVPSGVASDSGELLGEVPSFDLTLALGAWKRAHFLMLSVALMGARRLVPIGLDGLPETALRSARPQLSAPPADAHKYSRGLLAIVAGEMPGAPLLAAEAAMRSGAGYVKLLSEHSHPDAPADLVIEQGALAEKLDDERIAAILIGPGLGRGEESRDRLAAAMDAQRPMVMDADALHLLDPDLLEGHDASTVLLTPHEGELAALCSDFGIEASGKLERAQKLHQATGLNVLAKGADTILAGSSGVRFFDPATSWLSIAGTGDVLAGIAAGRLGLHGDCGRAAEEAVWLHGAAAHCKAPAFTASGLARSVDQAVGQFL